MADWITQGGYWEGREKQSFVTPDYHSKVRGPWWDLPIHPYTRWIRRGTVSGQFGHVQDDIVWSMTSGVWQTPTKGYVPLTTASAYHEQVSDALARKVRDPVFQSGVAFGERRQTAEMLTDALRRTARATRQAKRGRFREAYDTLTRGRPVRKGEAGFARDSKDVANNYLAYIYGVRPLIGDVNDAATLLSQRQSGIQPRTTRVRWSENLFVSDEGPSWGTTLNARVTVRGGLRYRINNPLMQTLQSVGLTNPASIAWELIPFSFVVDWFVNVGDWLLTLPDPAGLTFEGGWTSVEAEGTSRLWVPNSESASSGRAFYYNREPVVGSWPQVDLKVSNPFKGQERRIIDSMALARQSLRLR